MSKQIVVKTGFPCVICGEPRGSQYTKAGKFKLCSECYREIRSGIRPKKRIYQRNCEVCGETIAIQRTIPACGRCRTKWYRNRDLRIKLDKMIAENDFSDINMNMKLIRQIGYEIIIKKKAIES